MKVYAEIIVADITPDPDSSLSEYAAAFLAIGEHGAEGHYRFSMGEGTESAERVDIEVVYTDRPQNKK